MDLKPDSLNALFEGKTACCFTGHRPKALPAENTPAGASLLQNLNTAVHVAAEKGVSTFLAGGAMGFDTLAAESVLALKSEGYSVRLVLALPAEAQPNKWGVADKARYERILSSADEIHYASLTCNSQAMRKRNRYLAEHADCCICYLASTSGGTFYTVTKALECGIPVLNLRTGETLAAPHE